MESVSFSHGSFSARLIHQRLIWVFYLRITAKITIKSSVWCLMCRFVWLSSVSLSLYVSLIAPLPHSPSPSPIPFFTKTCHGPIHAGYPIVAEQTLIPLVFNPNTLHSSSCFPLLHELGHNFQMQSWTFDGYEEVLFLLFFPFIFLIPNHPHRLFLSILKHIVTIME